MRVLLKSVPELMEDGFEFGRYGGLNKDGFAAIDLDHLHKLGGVVNLDKNLYDNDYIKWDDSTIKEEVQEYKLNKNDFIFYKEKLEGDFLIISKSIKLYPSVAPVNYDEINSDLITFE